MGHAVSSWVLVICLSIHGFLLRPAPPRKKGLEYIECGFFFLLLSSFTNLAYNSPNSTTYRKKQYKDRPRSALHTISELSPKCNNYEESAISKIQVYIKI